MEGAKSRAKTVKEQTRFCETNFCFEIPAVFPHPYGNFKTNMRFTETNPFLYCLSSRGKEKLEQLPCEHFLQRFKISCAFLSAKQVGE